MAGTVQFYVDDTSPTITYSPFRDTYSLPNLTAGWNPYFDQTSSIRGEIGNGTSSHATSMDGASLSVQWTGTGIQIFGRANQATYTISIDGTAETATPVDPSNNILANFNNLTDAFHTVILTVNIPAGQSQPLFVFDKVLLTASAPAAVTQQALNDTDILYSGRWSFQNASGLSFHRSDTMSDRAEAQFYGVSFLMNGTTSPTSGRYTVILDNVATTLSANTSFIEQNTLLFFASGLNPNVSHTVQVINVDNADLSLNVGGFDVFAAGSIVSASPSATPSTSVTLSKSSPPWKGTIAALVLGSLLFCIIITSLLYFVFVARPRKRRHKLLGLEHYRKDADAEIVLNIGPESRQDEVLISPPMRNSEKSGFVRWKREMEGGIGGLIGISFRHSGSFGGKAPSRLAVNTEALSPKSSIFSFSSRTSSKRGKGKGKRKTRGQHVSEGSWSHNIAFELPDSPASANNDKGKDIDLSQDLPQGPHSVVSTLTSLSYVSSPTAPTAPTAHPDSQPAPPPSYQASNSNRNSHSTSEPRSVPHSVSHASASSTHNNGNGIRGVLQRHSDPYPGPQDADSQPDHHEPTALPLQAPSTDIRPAHAPSEHRVSLQPSLDDATSILGSSFTQLALRGLSPRTSEYVQPRSVETHKPVGERSSNIDSRPRYRPLPEPPLPEPPELRIAQSDNDKAPESPRGTLPDPPFDDSFLNVVPTSPFRVDFSSRQNRDSAISYMRFDDSKEELMPTSEGQNPSKEVKDGQDAKAKRRSLFRLTPPSGPSKTSSAQAPSAGRARPDSTSFLDFSSSSDSSTQTHSLVVSDEREGSRRWANLPLSQRLQSRWSNTATELSRNPSTGPPRSVFSGNFPYPVSLPTSSHHPEGHARPAVTVSTRRTSQYIHDLNDSPTIGVHPLLPISPADSMPISVTELQFRRNSTATHSTASPIPPHPPLPGRETEAEEAEDPATPSLSAPGFIVQRVLGQTPTISPSTPRHFPT